MEEIEKINGVHSCEHEQVPNSKNKTTAEKYALFHKLDDRGVLSNKIEDVGSRGKTRILQ